MYNEFYDFDQKPFNVTPDPDFIYYSEQHKEALAHMLYGVEERRGFLLVTGRVGSGKTTLCRVLLEELGDDTNTALILNSKMGPDELLRTIAEDFGANIPDDPSRKEVLDALNNYLLNAFENGENACVVVDESQNLSPEALEQLRLLSNLETEKQKLLQIVLVGQPELENTLNQPELRQLKQRIAVKSYLSNLNEQETREYVQHRIQVASKESPGLSMQERVFPKLFRATEGNPRAINMLGDRMLMAAYVEESRIVRPRHLNSAIEDLTSDVPEVEERDSLILRQVLDENVDFRPVRNFIDEISSLIQHRYTYLGVGALVAVLGILLLVEGFLFDGSSSPTVRGPTPSEMESIAPVSDKNVVADTPTSNSETSGEEASINKESVRETTQAPPLMNEKPLATSNESTTDETPTEISDTEGTASSSSLEAFLVAQDEDSAPPNPLRVPALSDIAYDTELLDWSKSLSLLRLVSTRLHNSDSPTFNPDKYSFRTVNYDRPLLIDQELIRNQLNLQEVTVNGSRDELLRFGFPTLLELNRDGNRRYALYLPGDRGLWDPFGGGWLNAPNLVISDTWSGEGIILSQAPFELNRLMTYQQAGARVREFQRLLNETGRYDIPLVGNYGPMTRSKVMDFQQRHGLPVDGVGGPKTYLTLLSKTQKRVNWSEAQLESFLEEVKTRYVHHQEGTGQSARKRGKSSGNTSKESIGGNQSRNGSDTTPQEADDDGDEWYLP
jgi:type II secretory pathway predicted ATPase ExeA